MGRSPAWPPPGRRSSLAGKIPDGTIWLARAIGLDGGNLAKTWPTVRLVESLDAAIGTTTSQVFLTCKLTAKTAEAAGQIAAAVEGLRRWRCWPAATTPRPRGSCGP